MVQRFTEEVVHECYLSS